MVFTKVVGRYRRRTEPVVGETPKEAIKYVRDYHSFREAENAYGISKSTICKYNKKQLEEIPAELTQGRFKYVFTEAQEAVLVQYALDVSRRFYALTRKAIGQIAYSVAEENGLDHRFRNGTASDEWVSLFIERHPSWHFEPEHEQV
ncbi:unnamed protein product [Allacma fusca]|uniref:HTH CENPB-type domain-containing protein n=1 Tax=Allacma fusca TaxID=39272 RepID=A0A8J2L6K4_9HEXA|nr:unnamed protein product [Allacma fusca]